MTSVTRRGVLVAIASICSGPAGAWELPSSKLTMAADQPHVRQIALVMKTLTNPFFVEMERGARRAEAALDIQLLVKTAAQETSIEQQIIIVEGLIRQPVDAIVIAPGDSYKLIPVLRKAHAAGIVVVNIDNRLNQTLASRQGFVPPFIGVDNRRGAAAAVRVLTKGIVNPTEAAIIEGIRSAANAEARKQGALDAFAEKPQIRLVAQETANWKIDEAHDVAGRILDAHPLVKIIYCANDMMALGVIQQLKERGRSDVLVGGFDALPETMSALNAGHLTVTVDQRADRQGDLGVRTAVAVLNGKTVPPDTTIDFALLISPGR